MRKLLFEFQLRGIAIIVAILFTAVQSASGNPVSLEDAKLKAQRFFSANQAKSLSQPKAISAATFELAYEAKTPDTSASCFYVLNQAPSAGYVIISADDRLPEVLGYSDNGNFNLDNAPDNMKWLLSQYERQIALMLSSADYPVAAAETDYRDGWKPVEPLIKSKWDQGFPYNNMCPEIDEDRCITGCVATAMAQIMNYHKWPETGRGSHSYVWNGQTLSKDFSTITFDWANIQDEYWGNDSQAAQDAVATLMSACGVSVNMGYGAWLSTASNYYVLPAFTEYFQYDAKFINRETMPLTDWETLVYTELENARPIYYSGANSSMEGHAFVCDGYSHDGLFHINWGWSGYLDGYYRLGVLDPYDDGIDNGYSGGETIVYGIRPLLEKVEVDGVYYWLSTNGEAIVTIPDGDGYYTGELIIPATITYEDKTYKIVDIPSLREYCKDLTAVYIYAEIDKLECSFYNQRQLKTAELPNVRHIYNEYSYGLFDNCRGLENVVLSPNLVYIGDYAFSNCTSLNNIVIPENVTTIGYSTFQNCISLNNIVIPENVITIGGNAFSSCTSLSKIVLSENLTTIGISTFQNCTSLNDIVIPENVTTIGSSAFSSCTSLNNIVIPENVTTIGNRAFRKCDNLQKIVIPNSVESLGAREAFYDEGTACDRIIISQIEEPYDIPENTFSERAYVNDELHVPYGAAEKYRAKEGWKNFVTIIEDETTTVTVGAEGMATYCPAFGVDFGNATKIAAYKATAEEENVVVLTRVESVAEGEGVLLVSLGGGKATEVLNVAPDAAKNSGNAFVGVLEETTLPETEGNVTNFVLSKNGNNVGFYKANNTLVKAGKAYLPVEGYGAALAKALTIVFGDEGATGIDEVAETAKDADSDDDVYYTLSGVRVKNPTAKGLYIKGGKKYILK